MPTIKQKKAFKEVGVNGGNITKAMKAAGYGKEVSKRTDKLTQTKGWKEMMEKFLPDSLLAKRHKELLNKQEVITKNNMTTGEVDVIPTGEMDVQAVKAGLDMAYKLKGAYAPEKHETATVIVDISKILEKTYGKESK